MPYLGSEEPAGEQECRRRAARGAASAEACLAASWASVVEAARPMFRRTSAVSGK